MGGFVFRGGIAGGTQAFSQKPRSADEAWLKAALADLKAAPGGAPGRREPAVQENESTLLNPS
jgi:hypothetical protein